MYELVNKIQEEISRNKPVTGRTDETTYSTNIAFLPSGFKSVQSVLRTLSRLKKKWNVEVLEQASKLEYSFEDQIKITVEKADNDIFRARVLQAVKVLDEKTLEVDLESFYQQDLDEALNTTYFEFRKWLEKRIKGYSYEGRQYRLLENRVGSWLKNFKTSKDIVNESQTVARMPIRSSLVKEIGVVEKQMREFYKDDLGTVQMIVHALQEKTSLEKFEFFQRKNYLIAARLEVSLPKVLEGKIVYETGLDLNLNPKESLLIQDRYLLDEVSARTDVKVMASLVAPKGGMFSESFFKDLKTELDLITEKDFEEDDTDEDFE